MIKFVVASTLSHIYLESDELNMNELDKANLLIDRIVKKLKEIDIVCYPGNIRLYDLDTNCEIRNVNDLVINNTKSCKIIIKPIQCIYH